MGRNAWIEREWSLSKTNLSSGPLLAGLAQGEDIVTADEARALVEEIDRVELPPFRFHGWVGKRLTASFGWHYDFEGDVPADGPNPRLACAAAAARRALRRFAARRVRPGHADPV